MAVTRRPMPADLVDETFAELDHNLWEKMQVLQAEWRVKENAGPRTTYRMSDIDIGDINWHQYEPPGLLRKAPDFTPSVLLQMLFASVENVQTRIAQEDRQRQLDDERRKSAEEQSHKNDKLPEPYLPIIIPPERLIEPDASPTTILDGAKLAFYNTVSVKLAGKATEVAVVKNPGWRRLAIHKLFHKTPEMGESSAAGGVRETLRKKLEVGLRKIDIAKMDVKTQHSLLALMKSGFIQVAEPSKPEPEIECVSCLDDVLAKNAVKVQCHSYCKVCFVRLITAATQDEQRWPPKCCLNQIPFRVIHRHIPNDLKKKFQERSSEWDLPVGERVYCSQPECGVWIRPKKIRLDKRLGRCERGHMTCTICRGPSHGNGDCPQDYDLNLTNILAEGEGWKRCPRCRALVEHREACQHMTCRCGTQFCYVCGMRWKTCRCTMEQLYALKKAADVCREKRHLKEQIEAEDLTALLARIEEIEREEAARAELEGLDEKEQVKDRIRLAESIRRQEVKSKFQQLRLQLYDLHELQHLILKMKHEDLASILFREATASEKKLAALHEMQGHELLQEMSQHIAWKEDSLEEEYACRVNWEQKTEQMYLEGLQGFWGRQANGEKEIEQAMLRFMSEMDEKHKAWQVRMDEEMKEYKEGLEEERIMKEEIMYSQRQRMKDTHDEQKMELTRRMVAEQKWFREVVCERERLLGALEVAEMEQVADGHFCKDKGRNT
ncbi:hypothetical protein ED733_008790 [Metarhizium rileyi]|uniref:RBR-type E3 ubiquitin transferase n=1 Tax=Metarhizium rileyi (strain RCEF 4871) TaxID=1649241 RepID=A0A5C6GNM1_METRR|nr:hypothetical protein ED733_008790 [Metarhizium rileyi]